jgi:hypothetical protein
MKNAPSLFVCTLFAAGLITGAGAGSPAEYLGGTLPALQPHTPGRLSVADSHCLVFQARQATIRIPYERINLIEYGQTVDRRLLEAILISPLLILSKKRAHYVTVGYESDDGRQQALVFRVGKGDVRAVLVSLEARSGRKVTFQDEEARKAGRG